jgi:hypothetical protein
MRELFLGFREYLSGEVCPANCCNESFSLCALVKPIGIYEAHYSISVEQIRQVCANRAAKYHQVAEAVHRCVRDTAASLQRGAARSSANGKSPNAKFAEHASEFAFAKPTNAKSTERACAESESAERGGESAARAKSHCSGCEFSGDAGDSARQAWKIN